MYDSSKPYKESVLDIIQETWNTPYVSVSKGVYPVITKKFSLSEVDHTDGIGTKGVYHWRQRTFRSAVLDALAMNLNDLALVRAIPYKLQNHIFIPEDNRDAIYEIVQALVQECKVRNIAITGGETSIHNNVDGLDISITMSGFVEQPKTNMFEVGDIVFGLKSNGLHSNGFTKIREVFGEVYREEFVVPTKIYLDEITSLNKTLEIHGMMHITGGAFTKPKDLLQDGDLWVRHSEELKPQQIFYDIHAKGVSDEEMYRTFNCGIGFIFSVSKSDAEKIPSSLETYEIGKIVSGTRKVVLESAFTNQRIEL